MSENIEGGCFCGHVRYKISGKAVLQLMCFCKDCLSTTGTDGYAGFMVKSGDFHLVQGKPSTYDRTSKEGRNVKSYFCGICGSNLWGETTFGLNSVAAGTLDDPNRFHPTKKAFAHDAPKWARIPENLDDL